jgi:hypothetical protein
MAWHPHSIDPVQRGNCPDCSCGAPTRIPMPGEWEHILSWLVANPERRSVDIIPRAAAPLYRTLSALANLYADAEACGK